MSETLEKCANCGRTIGKLETPYEYQKHIVCVECANHLNARASSGRQNLTTDNLSALASASRRPGVQTVELTAKKWKAMGCLGGFVLMFGVLVMIGGWAWLVMTESGPLPLTVLGVGAAFFGSGLIVSIYARMGAWWHHG